jgi:hypothetical protein
MEILNLFWLLGHHLKLGGLAGRRVVYDNTSLVVDHLLDVLARSSTICCPV